MIHTLLLTGGGSWLPGDLAGPQVKTSRRPEWKERRGKHACFLHTVRQMFVAPLRNKGDSSYLGLNLRLA